MKKKKTAENYLERIPMRPESLTWSADDQGMVTLAIENKGLFNRVAQKLLKKPKVSYVHLDEMGSFVWPLMNGEDNLIRIGEQVEAHFGDKAQPLYERLSKYFQILDSYGFVTWQGQTK